MKRSEAERVLSILDAELSARGWLRLLSTAGLRRPGRPVWGYYFQRGTLYMWWQATTRKRRSARGWRVSRSIEPRNATDGTGRGWARKAAERIAAQMGVAP